MLIHLVTISEIFRYDRYDRYVHKILCTRYYKIVQRCFELSSQTVRSSGCLGHAEHNWPSS